MGCRCSVGHGPMGIGGQSLSIPVRCKAGSHCHGPGPTLYSEPGPVLTEDKATMLTPGPRVLQLVGISAERELTAGATGQTLSITTSYAYAKVAQPSRIGLARLDRLTGDAHIEPLTQHVRGLCRACLGSQALAARGLLVWMCCLTRVQE